MFQFTIHNFKRKLLKFSTIQQEHFETIYSTANGVIILKTVSIYKADR